MERPDGTTIAERLLRALANEKEYLVVVARPAAEEVPWSVPASAPIAVLETLGAPNAEATDELAASCPEYERYKTVVLLPPLGRDAERRFDRSEWALKSLSDSLADEVRLVALLPGTVLGRSDGRSRPINDVRWNRPVRAVVDVPIEVFSPDIHRSTQFRLVAFQSSSDGPIVLVGRSPSSDAHQVLGEYEELRRGTSRTENGFLRMEPLTADEPVVPAILDPRRAERTQAMAALGELRPLSDLCEIFIGGHHLVNDKQSAQRTRSGIPVLGGRMLTREGIDFRHVGEWAETAERGGLKPGDIVVRRIVGPNGQLMPAEIAEDDLPLVASSSVVVLRPREELRPGVRRILRHFIESGRFRDQLESASLGGMLQVSPRDLGSVQVPMADPSLLAAVERVEEAESVLREWHLQAKDLLRATFEGDDLALARRQLIAESNVLRQRAAAAALLDDIGHLVATRYPFPVAHRWRAALAAQGTPDLIRAVLHAYEVLLVYLGAMGLCLARDERVELPQVKDIKKRLSKGRAGVGLGDWSGILAEVGRMREFRRVGDDRAFVEVRDFLADDMVEVARKRLASLRNDNAHLREMTQSQKADADRMAWSDLVVLYRAAAFLTDYPLVSVVRTAWDSVDECNTVTFKRLAGDNAVVPSETLTTVVPTIDAGSVYLLDQSNQFHLLRPFLLGAECPACGHWSTFHPDRVGEGGVVEYKSLEHGHPAARPSEHRALAKAGWLD